METAEQIETYKTYLEQESNDGM